jgi:hypothetical protein
MEGLGFHLRGEANLGAVIGSVLLKRTIFIEDAHP